MNSVVIIIKTRGLMAVFINSYFENFIETIVTTAIVAAYFENNYLDFVHSNFMF